MRKIAIIVCALLTMVIVSGCGSSSTTGPTVILPANVLLTSADVSGKTFYSTTINGFAVYQTNADLTASWNNSISNPVSPTDTTGTWGVPTTGNLVLTLADTSVAHTFTCLQKETSYFLMSDESGKISRFYFTQATAQAYFDAVVSSASPLRAKLGGSVQGTALPSTFSNMTTFAGTKGSTGGLADTASGFPVRFSQPSGMATDGSNIYVADRNNNVIRKIVIATGVTSRLAGNAYGYAGYANSTDGTGNTATFNLPTAVTIYKDSIYVADTGNNSIRKIDISSGVVTLIAGSTTGLAGSVDALNGTDAKFNQPTGITTDGTNLYVADSANNTIRKIVISTGSVTTLAGTATVAGFADSIGTAASFNQPARITTDGSQLYVTDFRNGTIRKIVIATGAVTTLAGSARNLGNVNDSGSAARFNQPNGITTDGANLYVIDTFYNSIRKIQISDGSTTTITLPGTPPGSLINPTGITTDGLSLFVAETTNVAVNTNDNSPVYTYGNDILKIQ